MTKKSSEELKKHTILLFDGDYERLQEMHHGFSAAAIVRLLVRKYLLTNQLPTPQEIKVSL